MENGFYKSHNLAESLKTFYFLRSNNINDLALALYVTVSKYFLLLLEHETLFTQGS